MLSRVADSMLWMSRYLERADNVGRFIDVNLHLMLDMPVGSKEQWEPLVYTSGDHLFFEQKYGKANKENVIQFLVFDEEYTSSILSCLRQARDNARSIREVITSEMWEQINIFFLMVHGASRKSRPLELTHDFFSELRRASQLFLGIADSTMSHGEGWHFCRLGRMLERADKTSRILDVKYFILLPSVHLVGSPLDDIQWSAVLRSASALEMYRQRFGPLLPERIVEFLLLDRNFPRSAVFCLNRADESLHAITGTAVGTFRSMAEQRLGQLRSELAYTTVEDVIGQGLHEFIDSLQRKLNVIGEDVFNEFFALRPTVEARI